MRSDVRPKHEAGLEPLDDAVDHVRGGPAGRLIVGDYECPYSRRAFREIEHVERLELDVALFDGDRTGAAVLGRVRRNVQSGMASGEVLGTPTLFIDGVVHRGGYDAASLLEALAG
jgi:glutaredoxin